MSAVRTIFALLFCCVAVSAPLDLWAQIEGRVQDASGQPLSQANLRLLADTTVLEVQTPDSLGWFSFRAHPTANRIMVSALGMAPISRLVGDLLHPLTIILYPEPLKLPPLETAISSFSCPEEDDLIARRIWDEVMRAAKLPPSGSIWGAQVVDRRHGTTRPDDFGRLSDPLPGWWQVGGAYTTPFLDESKGVLRDSGYARPLEVSSMDGKEEAWDYPFLDGPEVVLLANPQFIRFQTFGIVDRDSIRTTLAFCDLRKKEPGLSGRLYLDSKSRPVKAEWRFHTPEPLEDAGGEAVFGDESGYFLPVSGVFWRRTPTGRYYQVASRYSPWYVGDRSGLRVFMRARATSRGGGLG